MSGFGPLDFPVRLRRPASRPFDLPPLDPTLVDFEALYELGAAVLEPVPEAKRADFRYWRGAYVARMAMNFARGQQVLNAGYDNILHFTDDYTYARSTAAQPVRIAQMTALDRQELSEATGYAPDTPLPQVVFALDQSFNEFELPSSDFGNRHGFMLQRPLTLDMIDPHSRELLEQLLAPPNQP